MLCVIEECPVKRQFCDCLDKTESKSSVVRENQRLQAHLGFFSLCSIHGAALPWSKQLALRECLSAMCQKDDWRTALQSRMRACESAVRVLRAGFDRVTEVLLFRRCKRRTLTAEVRCSAPGSFRFEWRLPEFCFEVSKQVRRRTKRNN